MKKRSTAINDDLPKRILELDPLNPNYYIEPAKLRGEIQAYKDTNIMSEDLGRMLISIAKRYASKPNFSGYTYKDDFVNDAIYRMVNQMNKINLDHPKCNPFAYLTLICHRVFVNKIYVEKKFQNIKAKYQETMYDNFEQSEHISGRQKIEDKKDIFDDEEDVKPEEIKEK